jgi:hypothetical protein
MPKNNVVLSEGLAILPESLILKKKKREKNILIAVTSFFEGLNLR